MDLEEEEPNKDICSIHGNKIEYYCVQCDKYFSKPFPLILILRLV